MDISILKDIQKHPLKLGGGFIAIVLLLWPVYQPYVVQLLADDFVTLDRMRTHEIMQSTEMMGIAAQFIVMNIKLDVIADKDERRDAYDIITGIEGDIDRHQKVKNDSPEWAVTEEKNQTRLTNAIRHKDCIVLKREGCDLIEEEIWRD